ncbi:DHA2 family efflux MFS transporter permease subunit [Gynuella sp.]|uniref:DHA2 family efflux MFS transporter permease subunit n=1 Tax=Gynuella sp. TaxID=2969146 RepID=UPI003D0C4B11
MASTTVTVSTHPPGEEPVSMRTIIAFTVMVFGMFMAILDIQVVSASLSEIRAGLAAGADEISWVQTSYLIAEVVMVPLSGTLARVLSTRVLFTVSAAGFTLSSALCATATSIDQMIIYRAFQGFIGGGMIPSVFAAAFTIFPRSHRNTVSAIVGLIATLAPTIGPTVGGYISHMMSWHWLFLINVFPGILVTLLAWQYIDFDKPDFRLMKKFDWWGLLFMAVFLGCLEYVLEEGNGKDWFEDPEILMLTAIMALGGIAFFIRVFRAEFPVVDLRAYTNSNFAVGSLFTFMVGIALYGLTYLYPLYLARIQGYDALRIGETMFISGLSMFLMAPIAGRLAGVVDLRVMMGIGFALFAVSTYMISGITADWGYDELVVPQILRGISLMMCMVPINNIALGTLPPERINNASGLFNLMRNLGGAVGLAIINTVLTQRTDFHYSRLSESIDWGNHSVQRWLGAVGHNYDAHGLDGSLASLKQLAGMVTQQSWLMAFADVFTLLACGFILLMILTAFLKKPAAAGVKGGH